MQPDRSQERVERWQSLNRIAVCAAHCSLDLFCIAYYSPTFISAHPLIHSNHSFSYKKQRIFFGKICLPVFYFTAFLFLSITICHDRPSLRPSCSPPCNTFPGDPSWPPTIFTTIFLLTKPHLAVYCTYTAIIMKSKLQAVSLVLIHPG